jgi:hypothetical protein
VLSRTKGSGLKTSAGGAAALTVTAAEAWVVGPADVVEMTVEPTATPVTVTLQLALVVERTQPFWPRIATPVGEAARPIVRPVTFELPTRCNVNGAVPLIASGTFAGEKARVPYTTCPLDWTFTVFRTLGYVSAEAVMIVDPTEPPATVIVQRELPLVLFMLQLVGVIVAFPLFVPSVTGRFVTPDPPE